MRQSSGAMAARPLLARAPSPPYSLPFCVASSRLRRCDPLLNLRSPFCDPKLGRFKRARRASESGKGVPLKVESIYVDDDDDGLVDAPVSLGDGFSFSGGKYSDEKGEADVWKERGSFLRVDFRKGNASFEKAKDPIFGLEMGKSSQTSGNSFQLFYVDEGESNITNESVLLIHGLPSQSYSFRKVFPKLTPNFRVIAFDWLGFGFSDKPQPNVNFDYSIKDYSEAIKLLVDGLNLEKLNLVVQGYFSPAVIKFASENIEKINKIILINPPILEKHDRLPAPLSQFTNFLLGEIFAQDPIRASDKLLEQCNYYLIEEKDLMVYRFPYLNSGMAGFALTEIARNLKKELKGSLSEVRRFLSNPDVSKRATIVWGKKDKLLAYDGVSEFVKSNNIRLYELQEVGHHAQEDFGEEVGKLLSQILVQP